MDSKTTLTHSMVSSWMDRPIVDGRWRVHINGEGGMMVSVDLWLRWSRVKRVMVTSEASNGRVQWHSYGGSFWSVLPHTAHFVIPVSSLIRHPCVLTPMTCLLTHLIVIPDFSLESSHPSHLWLLTHITRVTTHPILSVLTLTHTHRTNPSHLTLSLPSLVLPCSLIPACSHITPTTTHSHECSHTECSHTHRHPWLLTHTTRLTLTHSSPRSLSPHFSECSHPSLVFSYSPSHIECHHTHSHILLTCVTTLSDLTSLVFWESVCSHFHGVVLPPSVLSHCLLSHTLSHSCHPCQHFHGVVLPPSLPTHSHTVFSLTHTSMVSYYHQVITHPHQSLCSHSLPSTMSSHTLLPSLHFTSFSPPTHPNSSPTLSHPSCLHRIIITSYHLSPPITTNRFLSLHTTLLTPPFHSQPSQSSPKSSPIPIHTHSSPRRTP